MYEKIGANSGEILEQILEWDGTLDEFSMETSTHFPNFSSNKFFEQQSECYWKRITLNSSHSFSVKDTSYKMLLTRTLRSDISGIQDVQSYSPVYNVTFQKYSAMTLNKLLDSYPLPKNSKEVEEQSSGRNFHFLHSKNPDTINTEIKDSLDCATSFRIYFRYQYATDKSHRQLGLW